MQSTGHTSTQERSFTPMQGSAMMYGMRVLSCLFTPLAGPNRKHRLGPPPVKCASRSRFAPAANAGTRRFVGTAHVFAKWPTKATNASPSQRDPDEGLGLRRRDARPHRRVLPHRGGTARRHAIFSD